MREKTIEQKFRAAVKAAGGLAVKFASPGFDGVPDRLALLPGGRMACGGQGSWEKATPPAVGTAQAASAVGI